MKTTHNSKGCIETDGAIHHEYSEKDCSGCGATYCYTCSGLTNVDQGAEHRATFMLCPVCDRDYYKSNPSYYDFSKEPGYYEI